MRIYFDTNIYNHLRLVPDAPEALGKWRAKGWSVVASSDNLFEMFAIPDPDARSTELRILSKYAASFDREPESFREAKEVLQAIRRYRPDWIRPLPNLTRIKIRLRDHVKRWQDAKKGITPQVAAYKYYRRVYEESVSGATGMQRQLRKTQLRKEMGIVLKRFGNQIAAIRTDLENPEFFWRIAGFLAYDGALIARNSQTRDFADWLVPWLKQAKVTSGELFTFWMTDVQPSDVPRSRWIGLVTHAQLRSKISHGNPADLQHSGHALDVDLMITADRSFFSALVEAKASFRGPICDFAFWDRRLTSAVSALEDLQMNEMT